MTEEYLIIKTNRQDHASFLKMIKSYDKKCSASKRKHPEYSETKKPLKQPITIDILHSDLSNSQIILGFTTINYDRLDRLIKTREKQRQRMREKSGAKTSRAIPLQLEILKSLPVGEDPTPHVNQLIGKSQGNSPMT